MNNYKLTLPRTLLFAVLLLGGIYYFSQNGFDAMATHEIVLSLVLMLVLLILIVLKVVGLVKGSHK